MRHNFANTNAVPIDSGAPNIVGSTIDVSGVSGLIRDVNVAVDIDHTWTRDLRISLVGPDGTSVLLVSGEGGDGDNFRDTRFDDAATETIEGADAPFRGTFRPEQSLTAFNGKDANGTWTLRVEDREFQDGGQLGSWSIGIESCCYHFENSTPVTIDPGPANTVTSAIAVTQLSGLVVDRVSVRVDIEHTWDRDLMLTLIGPDDTEVVLVEREGSSGDNFESTIFDDDASSSIRDAAPPFRGTFSPEEPLAGFRDKLINGVWTLRIDDLAPQDGGVLKSWRLDLVAKAAAPRTDTNFRIDVRFVGGLTANQRAVFQLAAARWSEIIVGDLPGVVFDGEEIDDVLIYASGEFIDGAGGTLGAAGPLSFRSDSGLPYRGLMRFDRSDLADMEANGSLINVIIHEMGHVLGIGTLWHHRGFVSGSGTTNPLFTGEHAVSEYARLRGQADRRPVPIANTGGEGTAEGHWRESTFDNELMTGYIDRGENPLSRLTIASLKDLGYDVDLDAADPYPMPGFSLRAAHACDRCRIEFVQPEMEPEPQA